MSINPIHVVLIAASLGIQVAGAQSVSLSLASASASPNDVVSLDLSLLAAGSQKAASLQWQLEYSDSDFASVEVTAGPAATAAQKTIVCHSDPVGLKCAALGLTDGQLNSNVIENGVVAHVRLQVLPKPEGSQLPVKVVNPVASSSGGGRFAAASTDGTVRIGTGPVSTLSELSCKPSWISAPGSSTCTIRLATPAPAEGLRVFLASDIALLSFPDSVTVLAGNTEADFQVEAADSTRRHTGTLTAQAGGGQQAVALTVGRPITLTSMVCEPTATKPGDSAICAIRLSEAAAADLTINVVTSSVSLQAPSLVYVRSGQSNPRFRADVSPTSVSQAISVTATLGDSTAGGNITVSGGVTPILILPPPQTAIYGEQMQLQLSATDPGGSPITFSGTMFPAGASVTQDGKFRWTPQLSDRGTHTVRFWATNPNGLSTSRDLTIRVVDRKPEITGFVNAASQSAQAPCSPGGLATIFGTGITINPPESAPAGPLSSTLSDVQVKVNDKAVPLLFASSTQVNFQCPMLAPGSALAVTVESGLGVSAAVQSTMQPASPGIFILDAAGQGSIIVAHRQAVAMIRNATLPSEPAMPGDYVSIFATGLGPVSGGIVEGQPGPLDPLATVQGYVEVWIGGQPAEVQFAGLAPGFVGAYQVNAKVPANLSTDDRTTVTLLLRPLGGTVLESNKVTMAVESR